MIDSELKQELQKQLEMLSVDEQKQVVAYAQTLAQKQLHGIPGSTLLQFSGLIPKDDLAQIESMIEQDCEQVNLNEW